MGEESAAAERRLHDGETVECTIVSQTMSGYYVTIESGSRRGLLMGTDAGQSITPGTKVRTIFLGYNEHGDRLPLFSVKTAGDEKIEAIMAENLAKIGLTLEDLHSGDMDAMSDKANQFTMKIDIKQLKGDFDSRLTEIVKAWHALDEAKSQELLSRSKSDSSEPLLGLLFMEGVISQEQFETLTYGKSLVDRGLLEFWQMAVAYRDYLDGHPFRKAIDLRHWLKDKDDWLQTSDMSKH